MTDIPQVFQVAPELVLRDGERDIFNTRYGCPMSSRYFVTEEQAREVLPALDGVQFRIAVTPDGTTCQVWIDVYRFAQVMKGNQRSTSEKADENKEKRNDPAMEKYWRMVPVYLTLTLATALISGLVFVVGAVVVHMLLGVTVSYLAAFGLGFVIPLIIGTVGIILTGLNNGECPIL